MSVQECQYYRHKPFFSFFLLSSLSVSTSANYCIIHRFDDLQRCTRKEEEQNGERIVLLRKKNTDSSFVSVSFLK